MITVNETEYDLRMPRDAIDYTRFLLSGSFEINDNDESVKVPPTETIPATIAKF